MAGGAGEGAGYGAGVEMSFGSHVALLPMFLRSKWWIAGVFLLVASIALPAIWLLTKPQYRATSVVRVSPVVSRLVFKTEDNGIVPLYRSYRNTQVSIILGKTVLERVLDRDDVQKTRWYRHPPTRLFGTPQSHLERLRKDFYVRTRRDTELVDVSLATALAGDATVLVDAVVEEYKIYSDETLKQHDIQRLETLARERDRLQKEIDGLVATKFRVASRLGTVDPEELRSQLSIQLNDLETKFETLSRARSISLWDFERLAALRQRQEEEEAGSVQDEAGASEDDASTRYMADFEWRKLNLGLESARYQLEVAHQRYGESHPRISQLVASLDHAGGLVTKREEQLDATHGQPGLDVEPGADGGVTPEMLEQQLARFDHQLGLLKDGIARQRTKVLDAGEIAKDIAHYGEEIRYKSDMYEAVRTRLNALKMEGKAPARISIAAYAIKPSQPYKDRRILLTAIALLGAMVSGLGVAYLRGALDPRIREAVDVRGSTHVPFLGQLPTFSPQHDLMSDENMFVAESVRMVRTALLERLSGSGRRVVLITSSSSCAGKTSVAILLAKSMAQVGKRILLVEGDLRRPSIGPRLGLERSVGLGALLMGDASDDDAIASTKISGLDVLLAGDLPDSFNAELLANGVFSGCLTRWKETYDYILLDSPPVLAVADARILARHADGTIMVLRSAHCRRAEVIQTYSDLAAAGGELLGTVLVGVSASGVNGYYQAYSSYGNQPALKA